MKRSRLILLIFAVACVLVLASAGTASAATTNSALWCPNVVADGTAQQLGGLYISESNAMSIKPGDWVSITLPSFTELQKITFNFVSSSSYFPQKKDAVSVTFSENTYSVSSAVYSYGEEAALIEDTLGSKILLQAVSRQSIILKVSSVPSERPSTRTFRTYIYFDEVVIKPVAPEELESSDIKVTLDAPSTAGFSSGSVTIGKILTGGGSTITAASPTNITEDGGEIAQITLKEDSPGALKANEDGFPGENTVKLVLSPGFTWDTVTLIPQGGFARGSVDKDFFTERDGRSALYLKISKESSGSPGQIIIKASVKADESFTTARDVKVTYGGTNPGVGGERIAEVTVAKYLVSGSSVAAKSTLDVVAGRANQQIGNFTIAEGMPGDLPKGRLISLTLPEGAKWNRPPTVTREAGNGTLNDTPSIRDDGRTLVYTVKDTSTSRTTFCFKNATVDLALGAPEELTVTVKGPGTSGTVTVAHVQAPVAVSAAGGTVSIGVQEQAVGALTIQENVVGALRARDAAGNRAVVKLTLPSGVRFARTPAVKVTAGDLELDAAGIKLEDNDRTLVIPVKLSSATPVEKQLPAGEQGEGSSGESESTGEAVAEQVGSTVTVQDIFLTLDRTVPAGDITLEVSGSALSETGDLFSSSLNKLTCLLAHCLTPAPVATKAEAVFTIGSKKYRIGSEEKEMDVEPYVKNGRTYAPVRYLALAAGLNDENILWDGSNQTVTLLADKRVVQFKVGQKAYLIQGVPISIDAAPEIVNGRTMLPYRFVAQALGLQAEWNADARQVIIR
ncbi:copper amine oxidase N-terminal domain-containing protein [Desulfofundulus salinus]|uniref:Copper amine oxidase N-terminal domain-containing protein n=1 Tax=Desulfofundulus salinus TaxID=2419843 RepID=A0A494WUN0_9FIRM|nr:copper amine oxidase N-terminal domain-containing protein [Desulfofundulus salinum]RKO66573.1 copper amine oxidase N-terminal domain-containing protein [Desulfofundulus salinum]